MRPFYPAADSEVVGFGAIARPRTHLNVILDKSDSMDSIRRPTVDAVNRFLDEQRGHRVDELFVTLTTFGYATDIKTHYHAVPIEQVPRLAIEQYKPDGCTALYDAIAKGCADTDAAIGRGDRAIIAIVTDGHENASKRVTSLEQLLAIKAQYEERRNWTFVYIAGGAEAYKAGVRLEMKPGNMREYTADATGVSTAMTSVSQGLKQYRTSDDLQTDTFFEEQQYHPKPNWTQTGVILTDPD